MVMLPRSAQKTLGNYAASYLGSTTTEMQKSISTSPTDFSLSGKGAIRAGASGLIQSSQQMEGQRRPGLAALASAAFMIKCMEHGRIIPWDAGKGTWARHLGFEDMMEYKALELWP